MSKERMPVATHEGDLDLGGWLIHSYVLEDGRRVISQRGVMGAFNIKGRGNGSGHRLSKILHEHISIPLIYSEILVDIENPISFRDTRRHIAHGFEATTLIRICEVFLKARERLAIRTQVGHRYAIAAESFEETLPLLLVDKDGELA